MPSAEASLRSILTSGSPNAVAVLVSTRVYPRKLPQNVSYPAIRYQRISTPRSQYRTLPDGKANYASPRFQVDCFALSEAAVMTLAQAVYSLLEGFNGTVGGLRIDQVSTEDERADIEAGIGPGGADVYRQGMDFFIYHAE